MSWKELSIMDQKHEFILLWKSNNYTIDALTEMFSIGRTTAYKYINRYKKYGLPGLKEQSRRPHTSPNKTADNVETELLKLREKHQRWGSRKLKILLEDRLPNETIPSKTTLDKILNKHGLIKQRKSRKKVEPNKPIFDPLKPNEVWSADFKGKFRMGNKKYCYPLTIADSCTRFVFAAKGMHAANGKNTKEVFIFVFRKYGLPEPDTYR